MTENEITYIETVRLSTTADTARTLNKIRKTYGGGQTGGCLCKQYNIDRIIKDFYVWYYNVYNK